MGGVKMGQTHTIGTHKTTVSIDEGFTKVTYHRTAVVKFNIEKIVLNSGEWMTNTTKTRMNQASNQFDLGYTVFQKNFEWFVDYKEKTIPFEDGMILKR